MTSARQPANDTGANWIWEVLSVEALGSATAVGVLELAPSGAVWCWVNPALEAMTGLSADQLVGTPLSHLLPTAADQAVASRGFEAVLRRTDATPIHVSVECSTVDRGDDRYCVARFHDVSAVKAAEFELSRRATHDVLTGLPNRGLLIDRLDHALAATGRRGGDCVVLFIDIDNFKVVNDSLGHGVGDRLLVEVANVLRECSRASDTLGRLGGDEFLVICEDTSVDQAVALADRIAAALRRPIVVADRQFVISASVGIAAAGGATTDPSTLLRDADAALYVAKEGGRARHALFTEATHAKAMRRVELEADLRRAVGTNEFRVAFQPQVDLISGRVVGAEALVRWEPPGREPITPTEFIPVAEETGLIVELGDWVLDQACAALARGRTRGRRNGRSLRSVTVNVAAIQLVQNGFVEKVADTLRRWDVEPRSLCLELTEGALKHGGGPVLGALEQLEATGVFLSIDDFGTGYSSLSRLRDLPFEVIKIDRRFVDGLGTDPADTAIVSSIMSLAHAMGLHVIAEGVETEAQADRLVELGCPVAQGFLFAPAVRPDELWPLVRNLHAFPGHMPALEAGARGAGEAVTNRAATHDRARLRLIDEFMYQLGAPGTGS